MLKRSCSCPGVFELEFIIDFLIDEDADGADLLRALLFRFVARVEGSTLFGIRLVLSAFSDGGKEKTPIDPKSVWKQRRGYDRI